MRETKGGKERRNVRKSVCQFGMGKQEMPVAFARVSQTGESRGFMTSTFLELWAPCKARWLCAGVATKQLVQAGSAATLPQQENTNSEDLQRGRVYISGFICAVASKPPRRCTIDEFESLAVSPRWRWRMFQELFRRQHLRHKTSVWASGGPNELRRLEALLGR